jgi:hypothetical protein
MKQLLSVPIFCTLILLSLTRCAKQTIVHSTDTLIVKLHDTTTVHDTATRTLTVKPGPDDGQDCLVSSLPIYAGVNLSGNPDITASQWTYNAQGYGEATTRAYIEFVALDGLPGNAAVKSAKLYFTGLSTGASQPTGNSDYPGSPYGSPGNSCWLKRVMGNWSQDSITWNTMPPTTDAHEVSVAASTSQWNYNTVVDVTTLVQDIVTSGQNYGFCLQLQTEQIYRGLNFAGSRNADSTRWPKLEVIYSIH